MDPFRELATSISLMRAFSGGSEEQRVASADLFVALFHVAIVRMADSLRRAGLDARVSEGATDVTLRFNGAFVEIQRFSGQDNVRLKLIGFAHSVVPHEEREHDFSPGWTSIEVMQKTVDANANQIGEVLKKESAVRFAKR